jgi:trehalose 6-phosphate phosphatase
MIPWQDAKPTILTELAHNPRFGLISDVDGTLSHLVRVPEDALVTEASRAALFHLQRELPLVAVVSGRAAADVYERVSVPGLVAIGNHGLERWTPEGVEVNVAVAEHRPALLAAATEISGYLEPGMTLEDKGPTLTVHYRRTAEPQETAQRLAPEMERIAGDHGLTLHYGRMVFELRPPLTTNKGTAFTALIEEFDLQAALYLGDDTTDVDALLAAQRLREEGRCLSYGVGVVDEGTPPSVARSADLLASGVEDVEALLSWLANAVSASRT